MASVRMADPGVARQAGSLPVRVSTMSDLPAALGRLARLVAIADHLEPKTVGRLAAVHARTLLTLADVIARRDAVPGTAAPALLGAAGELRAHASTLAVVQAATRAWRSGAPDDQRPARQLRQIRRQLGHDRARLLGSPTDSDLRVVIASLHPAVRLAPAIRHAVTRHLQTGSWQELPPSRSRRPSPADVLVATRTASESAARLAVWLPKPLPFGTAGRRRTYWTGGARPRVAAPSARGRPPDSSHDNGRTR